MKCSPGEVVMQLGVKRDYKKLLRVNYANAIEKDEK